MINNLYNLKKGFSLTEILVATIVMSMIMGSVLAFVQYAGNIWHKGNEKISSQNYSRMAFELIKQDLLEATEVTSPQVGSIKKRIIYKKADVKYRILASQSVLIRTSPKSDAYDNKANTMRLAKNVSKFYVNRISSRTFEISLQINGQEYENDDGELASDTISSESMVIIAPGIQ